jgi:enoyl-[acyl-carrier-protein] reductase (NADH)
MLDICATPLSIVSGPSPTWFDTDASAAAVVFLASDESRGITGRHITIDASMSLN